MRWTPHVTVAAVLEKEQRFLLVQENIAGRSLFNQPAGHLEDNETILEATSREVLEETGWVYAPSHLVGIYHWKAPSSHETFLRFCFTGQLVEHRTEQTLDDCIEKVHWMTYEELQAVQQQTRSPLVKQCVDDYLAGNRIELSILNHL